MAILALLVNEYFRPFSARKWLFYYPLVLLNGYFSLVVVNGYFSTPLVLVNGYFSTFSARKWLF